MAKIMIAEDDLLTQKLIQKSIVTPDACQVVCVNDGLECLKLLETWSADLIILDINMPKLDGISVLREIRKDERYADIAILMLTSSREKQVVRSALSLGVTDFVLKPITPQELTPRIRLHSFRPTFSEIRTMLTNLHMPDSGVLNNPGLRHLDADKYIAFSIRNSNLPLCVCLPANSAPHNLIDLTDGELARAISIYGKGVTWTKIWPKSKDFPEVEDGYYSQDALEKILSDSSRRD